MLSATGLVLAFGSGHHGELGVGVLPPGQERQVAESRATEDAPDRALSGARAARPWEMQMKTQCSQGS